MANIIQHVSNLKMYKKSNMKVFKNTGSLWLRASISHTINNSETGYLTIIPQAQMGSKSMAHEAEGWMGYWLRGHEGERNNCVSKIQLDGQKYQDKTT